MNLFLLRTFCIQLVLLFHYPSFSQSYEGLLKKPFQWHNWETEIQDSTKFIIVSEIEHWLISDYYKPKMGALLEDIKIFRFIDLDQDGEDEIFYEGFIGGEPTGTIIFKKNSESKFSQFFIRMGTIQSLWRNKTNGTLYMETVLSPCCLGTTYTKETWELNQNRFNLIEKVNWVIGTLIPNDLGNPVKFRVKNDPYTLRSTPMIKDKNVLTTYKTDDIGYALAKKSDDTGRVWWFVFMTNSNSLPDNTFYDYAYDEPYFSVGWMSSKYLEKIIE